jgi:two-component system sensor histidine kinase DesK
MLEVHRVAHESAREVREVVAGYRMADLDAELAGARSVLRAAGVRVRVIGDGATFPRDAQAAFGWVLREATTNIIRHSAATACTIEIGTETGVVQPVAGDGRGRTPTCTVLLRVRNDGARLGTWRSGGGTGLTGLRERLTSVGGQLFVMEEAGGGFTVEARLPALAGAATTPDSAP